MASLDDFVRTNILAFPTLFPNRTAVLHHVLCVIGNGYKWSDNGEAVRDSDVSDEPWSREQESAELEERMEWNNDPEEARNIIREVMQPIFDEKEEIINSVDARVQQRAKIVDPYPQSFYALLMNIPANVTPEWREACEEMKAQMQKEGWVF